MSLRGEAGKLRLEGKYILREGDVVIARYCECIADYKAMSRLVRRSTGWCTQR